MKKNLFFIAFIVLAAAFTSCKKDNDVVPVPVPLTVSFAKDAGYTQKVVTGRTINTTIAPLKLSVSGDNAVDIVNIGLSFQADFGLDVLRNLHVVVISTDGMFVDSTYGAAVDWQLPNNKTYYVYVYADVLNQVFGTLRTTCDITYVGNDGNLKTISAAADTKFGYAIAPRVRISTLDDDRIKDTLKRASAAVLISSPDAKTAYKQMAWAVTFANNGTASPLRLDSMVFLRNGDTIPVTFSNAAGAPITILTESDTKFFVTFTAGVGEEIIQKGDSTLFEFVAKRMGFEPNKGDAVVFDFLSDGTLPKIGYGYVNKGTTGAQAKLYSSRIANGSATSANFIWSPVTSDSHSGIFGASSNDWFNGYGVVKSNLPSTVIYSRPIAAPALWF